MDDLTKPILSRVTTELLQPVVQESPPLPPSPRIVPKTPQPRKKVVWIVVASAVLLAIVVSLMLARRTAPAEAGTGSAVRMAKVERRDFVRTLRVTGTVEAVESYTVAAPRLAGQQIGQLTVTTLVPSGTRVQKGDLLVEFDRQDQIKNSIDKRAEYLSFVDQINRKKADQDAARAKDDTELKQAEDALETAKLEMRKNEVISQIDAEKNKENLDQAEATLKQLRETYDLKRRAAAADLKDLEIQRNRAKDAMEFADRNAGRMAIHAALPGLVVLNNIWKGGQMGEVQEGDQVRPGVPFMQVVNPDTMQVRARVNQADVPYLHLGQPVEVRLDAYPGMVLKGTLVQVAAIGETSGMSDKVHTFAVLFSIRGADPKLMPDLSAAIDVELDRRANALIIPRDALLVENERTYLSVRGSVGEVKREVKLGPVNDVDAVVESGVEAGETVLRGSGG